jgi:peptide/nickel transport system permease protein
LMAGITRLLRSGLLDAFDSDYVRLARLKGLSERRVVWKHALRNAMNPVLGFGSVYIALFLTGSVVTETVFAWPGLGRLMYDSMLLRDFPVLQGTIIVFVAVALLVNLFIDVLYSLLDPRIRLQ